MYNTMTYMLVGNMGLAQEHGQVYKCDLESVKFIVESYEIRQVMTVIPK